MPDYDKLRQEAIALREQGFSNGQIGRRLGLASATVWRWVNHIPFDGFNEVSLAEQLEARRDPDLYNRAIELRKQGYSYNLIIQELGVSKSTLSGWLKDVTFAEYHPSVRERIERTAKAAGEAQTAKSEKLKADAEFEATAEMEAFLSGGLSDRELFLMGLTLYWAEGGKTQGNIKLTNSDPSAIRLFILWVQKFLGASLDQFRLHIYTHPDVDAEDALYFWSQETSIPKEQFYKTTIDRRDKNTDKKRKTKIRNLIN